jgi:hypothetical protein
MGTRLRGYDAAVSLTLESDNPGCRYAAAGWAGRSAALPA